MSLINKELTINQISTLKAEAEDKIVKILAELERATGLEVVEIEPYSARNEQLGRLIVGKIEIRHKAIRL